MNPESFTDQDKATAETIARAVLSAFAEQDKKGDWWIEGKWPYTQDLCLGDDATVISKAVAKIVPLFVTCD